MSRLDVAQVKEKVRERKTPWTSSVLFPAGESKSCSREPASWRTLWHCWDESEACGIRKAFVFHSESRTRRTGLHPCPKPNFECTIVLVKCPLFIDDEDRAKRGGETNFIAVGFLWLPTHLSWACRDCYLCRLYVCGIQCLLVRFCFTIRNLTGDTKSVTSFQALFFLSDRDKLVINASSIFVHETVN